MRSANEKRPRFNPLELETAIASCYAAERISGSFIKQHNCGLYNGRMDRIGKFSGYYPLLLGMKVAD